MDSRGLPSPGRSRLGVGAGGPSPPVVAAMLRPLARCQRSAVCGFAAGAAWFAGSLSRVGTACGFAVNRPASLAGRCQWAVPLAGSPPQVRVLRVCRYGPACLRIPPPSRVRGSAVNGPACLAGSLSMGPYACGFAVPSRRRRIAVRRLEPVIPWIRRQWTRRSVGQRRSRRGRAASRSSGTRPIRVRRSSRSATSSAPSCLTAQTQLGPGDPRRSRLGQPGVLRHQRQYGIRPRSRSAPAAGPAHVSAAPGTSETLEGSAAVTASCTSADQGQPCRAARARVEASERHRPVHRVLGHPPVGGQLAAHDRHDPVRGGQQRVLPRQVGRVRPSAASSGRSPA